VSHHLALGLQPVADAARAEIIERQAQGDGAALQGMERRSPSPNRGRPQHAAMDDAQRIGVLRAGQEAADRAAVLDLLEPRPVAAAKPVASSVHEQEEWTRPS